LKRLDLHPDDYAAHEDGKPPFRFRRRWLYRLLMLVIAVPAAWFGYTYMIGILMLNEWSALGFIALIGIALPALGIAGTIFRRLPPK
jgi:hypothetical protein